MLNLILPEPCQVCLSDLHLHKMSDVNNISLTGSFKKKNMIKVVYNFKVVSL